MLELSSSNKIEHCFCVNNNKGESGIGYDNIIGRNLMVQLVLTSNFNRQVLQWDRDTVPMKEPRDLLGKPDLSRHDMREVVIQNVEPASTI